eukprot:NODE_5112_length_601_cov_45.653986_g4416_i0.p1 GENE.NODE_5112_length_601_cov_45.653986_g4416_i0~~NODE_5112_length_601_cov_45.653986_g4416_i0.p1  ORF type:complete len:143 (+),score=34.42 NODE_5112_length_601_cov_45.653986_g4416_i0:36-431(+)
MRMVFGGSKGPCTNCQETKMDKHFYFRCEQCNKDICRRCGEKFTNGDGYCYMLICLVNVGEVRNNVEKGDTSHAKQIREQGFSSGAWAPGFGNTVKGLNSKNNIEYILQKPERIYPAYEVRYQVDTWDTPL